MRREEGKLACQLQEAALEVLWGDDGPRGWGGGGKRAWCVRMSIGGRPNYVHTRLYNGGVQRPYFTTEVAFFVPLFKYACHTAVGIVKGYKNCMDGESDTLKTMKDCFI